LLILEIPDLNLVGFIVEEVQEVLRIKESYLCDTPTIASIDEPVIPKVFFRNEEIVGLINFKALKNKLKIGPDGNI